MIPTEEEYLDWIRHPVTRAVAAALEEAREDSKELLAEAFGRDEVTITRGQQQILDLRETIQMMTDPDARKELWNIEPTTDPRED